MYKILLTLSAIFLCSCTSYTTEEAIQIERERQKTLEIKNAIDKWEQQNKGVTRVSCEEYCKSSWDGKFDMVCVVNCINATNSGDILLPEHNGSL